MQQQYSPYPYIPQGQYPVATSPYVQPLMVPMQDQQRSSSPWPLVIGGLLGVGLLVAGGVLLYRRNQEAAADKTPADPNKTPDPTPDPNKTPDPTADPTADPNAPKKEVFHVDCGKGYVNGVKRDKAEAICKNFNADVATKDQMDKATIDGASWCSCGWVQDDQKTAYYPGTGQTGCGRANQLETCPSSDNYCVNCYGVKPARTDNITLKGDISYGRSGDMTVQPFNVGNNWSEWGYGEDAKETTTGTTAQMRSITLDGWEEAV